MYLLIVLSVAKIKPLVDEVEFHPYLYQKDLLEFCNLEKIKILAYNPLVKGRYCKERHAEEMAKKNLDLFNEPAVQTLAQKYGKTPGQIILNWEIKRGVIPIPSTSKPERMKFVYLYYYFSSHFISISNVSANKSVIFIFMFLAF